MKKILTLTLAILFCISSFAKSHVNYADISIGMSKTEFCELFSEPIKKNNVVRADENFQSFGQCHFVAFFSDDALTDVSICLNGCPPADFKHFDRLFKQAIAVVSADKSLTQNGTPVDYFTEPFAEGDGREFQALCLGYHRRVAEFANGSVTVIISSGPQGIITIATSANDFADQEVSAVPDSGSVDDDPIYNNIADIINAGPSDTDSATPDQEEHQPQSPQPAPGKPTGANDKLSLYFEGLPVTGCAADFANRLTEAYPKRFKIENAANSDQIFLKGTINGIKDCEIYIINGDNKLISSITVYFPAHTSWNALQSQYSDIKKIYDSQDWETIDKRDGWENGYSFQGHEMEGVQQDKCWYLTKYRINNRHTATLYISKYARVALYYEVAQQPSVTFPGNNNISKLNTNAPSN